MTFRNVKCNVPLQEIVDDVAVIAQFSYTLVPLIAPPAASSMQGSDAAASAASDRSRMISAVNFDRFIFAHFFLARIENRED
jgi:hypothetical protein